jgi:dUTP pyrophosphatase
MNKTRGFELVENKHRVHQKTLHIEQIGTHTIYANITLPTRNDPGSAGYDFYLPQDIMIEPGKKVKIWTDVKAYMKVNEVLVLVPRSSVSSELDIVFANTIGVVDASYYSNPDNDGNIGLYLKNNSGRGVEFKAGERIAQGIFIPYLLADDDEPKNHERVGGTGSSGK